MGLSQVSLAAPNCNSQISLDSDALLAMCRSGHFKRWVERFGSELEFSGITKDGGPDFLAYRQVPKLNQKSFQPEFGSNNVEWNAPAIAFDEHKPFTRLLMEQNNALAELKSSGIDALCCGVLPSMRREFYGQYDDHLDLEQMRTTLNPDKPRYKMLLEIWNKMNGAEKTIKFPGHSNVRIESCMALSIMSSFQIHYSVDPEQAADALDLAAMIAAGTNAPFVSSPRFFGTTGSWEDYRPLFWREIFPNRTGSGPEWAISLENILEQTKQFECIFGVENSHNPFEELELGQTPDLEALKTHMGCLWFDQRLKVHTNAMTIEERTKGSGTPLDNTAKAVFWTGLMRYFLAHEDIEQMRHQFGDFSIVEQNMLQISEKGLKASIGWLGKQISVRDLILDKFLPFAKQGHSDLADSEVDPYLSIIEKIATTGKTPAHWIRSNAQKLEDKGLQSYSVDTILCRQMLENQYQSVVDWM